MLDETEIKPVKKSAQRKRKAEQDGKKAPPRKRKPAAPPVPTAALVREAAETVDIPAALAVTLPDVMHADTAGETYLDAQASLVPAASADADAISYQTLVDAYCDYTRQSLDRTRTYFARLAGVRSLDQAIALQAEFARQAYDGFLAESRKLHELHGQLAHQNWQKWESVVARMTGPR